LDWIERKVEDGEENAQRMYYLVGPEERCMGSPRIARLMLA
jgi:hypothetical protein